MMYLRHGGSRTEKVAIGQQVFLVGVIIPKSKKSFCFPCQRARPLRLFSSNIQTDKEKLASTALRTIASIAGVVREYGAKRLRQSSSSTRKQTKFSLLYSEQPLQVIRMHDYG